MTVYTGGKYRFHKFVILDYIKNKRNYDVGFNFYNIGKLYEPRKAVIEKFTLFAYRDCKIKVDKLFKLIGKMIQ